MRNFKVYISLQEKKAWLSKGEMSRVLNKCRCWSECFHVALNTAHLFLQNMSWYLYYLSLILLFFRVHLWTAFNLLKETKMFLWCHCDLISQTCLFFNRTIISFGKPQLYLTTLLPFSLFAKPRKVFVWTLCFKAKQETHRQNNSTPTCRVDGNGWALYV